jgi:tetratricopeptide (TPR) repeat protein
VSVKAKWFAVAVTVIVSAVCLWRGPRLYSHYQEQKLAAQVGLLLRDGRYQEAFRTTQQLLGVNPANVDACRFMAELTERAKDPSTLVWRRRVLELSPTFENRLMLAAAALLFERPPYPLAQQTLGEIRALGQATAAYHVIAAQLSLKQNQFAEAQAHYQEAIRLEPEKESHQLNLAVLRLESNDPAVVSGARATLERLCDHPRLGAFALRSLVSESLEKKERERALQFSKRLLTRPQAVFGDRVQHLGILQSAGDPAVDEFLATLRREASTNELSVYQLAHWLIGQGKAVEALEWIETLPREFQVRQPVPKAVVEGLLARQDWSKLESFLNGQLWGGQDFMRLALMSLALRHQALMDSARLRLQEAVHTASRRVENLVVLSQLLESWGWQSEADEVRQQLVQRFPDESRAVLAVSMTFHARGNTPGLYEAFNAMLKSNPGDPATMNNLAMVCLLLNTNLDRAHFLAEQAYRSAPRNPAFVSTRAFSLCCQGRHSDALALFATLPRADLETPGIALYYAMALAAAGDIEQARKYSSLAEQAQLLPEEKKLLEQMKKTKK